MNQTLQRKKPDAGGKSASGHVTDRQETSVYGIVVERNRTVTIVLSC